MSDDEYRRELWRALIIVMKAMVRRYGFRLPRLLDD